LDPGPPTARRGHQILSRGLQPARPRGHAYPRIAIARAPKASRGSYRCAPIFEARHA